MNIVVYKKAGCPWAAAVIGFLEELELPFEVKDVTSEPEYMRELFEKTGQLGSPTVEINGEILLDASVEDVAEALESKGVPV